MANITELQLQGDSTVHKLNDARITTTAVTTATHILTTNSGVTSIAPITAANLASVLGESIGYGVIWNDTYMNTAIENAFASAAVGFFAGQADYSVCWFGYKFSATSGYAFVFHSYYASIWHTEGGQKKLIKLMNITLESNQS